MNKPIAAAIAVMLLSSAASASAGCWYWIEREEPLCGGCTPQPCQCAFSTGQCNIRNVCTQKVDVVPAASGYASYSFSLWQPCFVIYDCKPRDPNKDCAADNPCDPGMVLNMDPDGKNTPFFVGVCP